MSDDVRVEVLNVEEHRWEESPSDFSAIRANDIFRCVVGGRPGLVLVAAENAQVMRLDDLTGSPVYRVPVQPVRILL